MSPIDKLIILSIVLVVTAFILKGVIWLIEKYVQKKENK